MPLIACRECQKEISTHARSCPHCGYDPSVEFPSVEEKTIFYKGQGQASTVQGGGDWIPIAFFLFILLVYLFFKLINSGWGQDGGSVLGGI